MCDGRILDRMSVRREPPELLRRWENLHPGIQAVIVAPLAILLLWAAHVYLMNQSPLRGFSYGIFWAAILTGVVLAATRSERAKRQRRNAPRRET